MFRRQLQQTFRFAPDEPAGGSSEAADTGDVQPGEEPSDATIVDAGDDPGETQDDQPDPDAAGATDEPGEGEGDPEKASGKAAAKKPEKLVPLAALIDLRKKVEQRIKGMEAKLKTAEGAKPKRDKLKEYLDSLPATPDDSTEEGRRAANHRELFPLIAEAKEHVFPELQEQHNALSAALVAMDKLTFQVQQLMKTVDPEKLPVGLKQMDRLEQIRKESIERGEYVPYSNAFDQLQEQLEAEAQEAAAREEGIRTDERQKQDRERQQTRAAAGSGGTAPAARVPRGTAPQRMTPQEIERRIQRGEAVGIA